VTDYNVMKYTLEKIASVNAMDYEYQAWAREALDNQPAQQEPLGFMNPGNILEMQQESLPYAYVYPVKSTGVSVAVYTSPPVQQKPLTDERQIAEALRAHGLTLVKTESGYKVLKLGQITALDNQPTPPPECQTEAEKTAFAFGWWKALEHIRMKKTNQVSNGGMDPRK
jgi:hypothetical protein